MDSEQLHIAGLTGVEVTLDIAGAGSRSYAFVIDLSLRLLFALAWFIVIGLTFALIRAATASVASEPRLIGFIAIAPAVCIYFFYHPLLEVLMHGRTPGKRMAGVRIVTRSGGTPSVGALLIRNVFRLIDSLPASYLLGLVTCLFSAQRVRIGDMAAGTLLVLDDPNSANSLAHLSTLVNQTGLPLNVVELTDELLKRWYALEVRTRDSLARTILGRVQPSLTAEILSGLNDIELQRRLRMMLSPRTSGA